MLLREVGMFVPYCPEQAPIPEQAPTPNFDSLVVLRGSSCNRPPC